MGGKEVFKQLRRFIRTNASHHFSLMQQTPITHNIKHGTHGARARFVRTKNEASNAGVDDGAGAHRAGLQRHDKRAVVEPPRTEGASSLS